MYAHIRAFLAKNSIQHRLLLVFSLFTFLSIILVSLFGHLRFVSDYTMQSAKDMQQIIEQAAMNIDTYIDELSRLCLSPYYNSGVMNCLEESASGRQEELDKQRQIEDYLRQVMITPRKDILRVYILADSVYSSSKSGHIGLNSNYESEEWYLTARSTNDYIFLPAHSETDGGSSKLVISVAKRLCSLQNSQNTIGVIRVDANYNGIKAVCDRISVRKGGALFIMDSNWTPVYTNSKLVSAVPTDELKAAAETIGYSKQKLGHSEFIINVESIPSTGWHVIAVNASSLITKNANVPLLFNLGLAIGVAALGVAISAFLVRKQLRPLYKTISLMEKVENGDLNVRASTECSGEIASLNSAFNHMLKKLREMMEQEKRLTKQVYEAKYLQKEAQFDSLNRQIRPHFLFNTLNTINLLIKSGKYRDATQGIEQLATLLRGVINSGREIKLETELKIADSYLRLQQLRHDCLTYQIEANEVNLSCLLPALTVQPIIENALIHGCEKAEGDTHILVDLRYSGDALKISVTDNGVGIPEETLRQLRESLEQCESGENTGFQASGIGLLNIQKRIRFKFGKPYGISVFSEESKGTTAILYIPRRFEKC